MFLKDGKTPSAYGLMCGYVQHYEKEIGGKLYELHLYEEHNTYHIKQWIYKDETRPFYSDRILWITFECNELTKARKQFNKLKKQIER